MKKLFMLIIAPFLLYSCCYPGEIDSVQPVNRYQPLVLKRSDFEKTLALQAPKTVINSGKIYIKGNLMFVNEVNQGFHVYDYKNPQLPKKIHFINAPGATDLAIKNNLVYINQAVDLITLSYDETSEALNFKSRIPNTFPQKTAPNGTRKAVSKDEIIVDWILKN